MAIQSEFLLLQQILSHSLYRSCSHLSSTHGHKQWPSWLPMPFSFKYCTVDQYHTCQPLVVLRTGVSDVCIPACICIHFLAFNYIAASSTAHLTKWHTAGECSFDDWMTSCYTITKLVSYEFSNCTAALEKLIWQKFSISVHLYIKCRQKHGLSHQLMQHTVKKTVNYCCSLTI